MKASEADSLKQGDTVYACFGGHPQECKVERVQKERSCRRIFVWYINKARYKIQDKIRHQSAWV